MTSFHHHQGGASAFALQMWKQQLREIKRLSEMTQLLWDFSPTGIPKPVTPTPLPACLPHLPASWPVAALIFFFNSTYCFLI